MRIFIVVFLASCGAQLDPSHVRTLAIESSPTYCANRPPPRMHVTATLDDGSTRVLDATSVRWSDTVADGDPLVALGRPVTVRAVLVGREHVDATLTLTPDYACHVTVEANGASGVNGRGGRHSLFGEAGSEGEDGGSVDVALGLVATPIGPLALARLTFSDGRDPRYIAIAPTGPALLVSARGGVGGVGGHGRYGRGADAEGGTGGSVLIRYDAAHPELRALVKVLTEGGTGRGDGKDGEDGGARYEAASADSLFEAELAQGAHLI